MHVPGPRGGPASQPFAISGNLRDAAQRQADQHADHRANNRANDRAESAAEILGRA